MDPLPTYFNYGPHWLESEPSYISCCNRPDPIEIEQGELSDYEIAYNELGLNLDELSEKEELILRYLLKEGRLANDNIEKESKEPDEEGQLYFDFL